MMPLVAKNAAFKALHEYYTKRPDNPLKKMQSLIALCNKLIRVLFGILKKGHEFRYPSIRRVTEGSLNAGMMRH
jgi:transposase